MNKGTWTIFAACEKRKRTTAIKSCVKRKKSGAEVDCSTHLFLQYLSRYQDEDRNSAYAMTIYETGMSWQLGAETQHHIPPMLPRDRTTPSPSEVALVLNKHQTPRMTYHKEVVILLLRAGAIL